MFTASLKLQNVVAAAAARSDESNETSDEDKVRGLKISSENVSVYNSGEVFQLYMSMVSAGGGSTRGSSTGES